ncbi:MAG: c-type cytochrome [Gallionellaceae bacterium]|nr:c-type cytochrome [Gallionellaceae bacterium]
MKILTAAFAAAALIASSSVLADEALAKKNGCAACHDMSAKKVGPTWKDIAAKTKGDAATITAAIEKGSKGKYGKIPMPPQPKAKGDAAAIAKWIASIK